MSWKEPITDRTRDDVNLVVFLTEKGYKNLSVDEKKKWDAGLKGANNKSDWERVEGNIEVITHEPARQVPDIITAEYYKSVIDRIKRLREENIIYQNTPLCPERPINTYIKMNAIEKIIFDVHEIKTSGFVAAYCGEAYCGEITAGEGGYL